MAFGSVVAVGSCPHQMAAVTEVRMVGCGGSMMPGEGRRGSCSSWSGRGQSRCRGFRWSTKRWSTTAWCRRRRRRQDYRRWEPPRAATGELQALLDAWVADYNTRGRTSPVVVGHPPSGSSWPSGPGCRPAGTPRMVVATQPSGSAPTRPTGRRGHGLPAGSGMPPPAVALSSLRGQRAKGSPQVVDSASFAAQAGSPSSRCDNSRSPDLDHRLAITDRRPIIRTGSGSRPRSGSGRTPWPLADGLRRWASTRVKARYWLKRDPQGVAHRGGPGVTPVPRESPTYALRG